MHELITIDVSGPRPDGLGRKTYKHVPRRGEWVELEEDGKGYMFEVVMVAHSSVGPGCDIYVRRLGITADVIGTLME